MYLPSSNCGIDLYRACIEKLEEIVHRLNDHGTLFIAGDFNAHIGDFGGPRSFNTTNDRGRELIDFMDRLNLKSVNSQHFCKGPIETFYGQNGSTTTTIDHILVNMDTLPSVIDCQVESEHPNNLSFHLPIVCTLNQDFFRLLLSDDNVPYHDKLSWKRIGDTKIKAKYQKCVKEKILLDMADLSVNSANDLESTIVKFNKVLVDSARDSIPKTKFKPYLKPYWNANFKQLHYEVRKCRREWSGAGRPRSRDNTLFLRYKEAKRKFRKELRKKALEHEINDYDELQRVFEVDRSEFHKRVSKRSSTRDKSGNALEIDGNLVTDRKEVLGIWRDHYGKLYSPLEHANFDENFRMTVEKKIEEYSTESFKVRDDPLGTPFEVDEVAEICQHLPNGKAGGLGGIQYEHLKYDGYYFWSTLTNILNSIRAS